MSLKRDLGAVDTIALGVNAIIGSGIFFLPGLITEKLGAASLLAVVLAAAVASSIGVCFAEVGSAFPGTGGAYLYASRTLGRAAGFQVGWLQWFSRLCSWAALLSAFGTALADTVGWPRAGWASTVAMSVLLVLVMIINMRGVGVGGRTSTVFSAVKILALFALIGFGLTAVSFEKLQPFAPHGYSGVAAGTLTMFYAFTGFEGLAVPSGEMKNPGRTLVVGLFYTLAIVSVIYIGVAFVTVGVLGEAASGDTAVLRVATASMGSVGGTLMSVAVVVSLVGINAAMALITPRCLFALAEEGDMPAWLARLHPTRGTPVVAILTSSALVGILAFSGSFAQLSAVSVLARFMQYIPTCVALLILRRGGPASAGYRVPGAPVIAVAALLLSVWILSHATLKQWLFTLGAGAAGLPFFLWMVRRGRQRPAGDAN